MAKKIDRQRQALVQRFLDAGQSLAEAKAHADKVLAEPDLISIGRDGKGKLPTSPLITERRGQ